MLQVCCYATDYNKNERILNERTQLSEFESKSLDMVLLCRFIGFFIVVLVLYPPHTQSASVSGHAGCAYDGILHSRGDKFTDKECKKSCECIPWGQLSVSICSPLCHAPIDECFKGEVKVVKYEPAGLKGSGCTCKVVECKSEDGTVVMT
ncbi:predicted protein [Nematostella vectensis]|uniref:Uncharacterized protein n=1 Tax=Nematostella vectensis TaxID=45351 RepID=A7SSI9_NEMVE|nr:uncharacterized protein LOC5504530 [Nematostella vectensis]EDO33347.1 predicted protein [Nematostella vectensis]|eukprot:XP_001625447.1 predicted protein [Nematostella vectensis]